MASVEFKGIPEVQAALERLRKRLQQGGQEAGAEQSKKILRTAQGNAPVDTGELVASGSTRDAGGGRFEVVFDAPHAAVVHQRHPSKAQYLRRAVEGNRTEQGYADKLRGKLG